MKYSLNFDIAKARVNTKIRAGLDDFPEIIFENCILVSNKDTELQNSKIDRLNTIIYPEGCQNLGNPETVFLNADFRHATYDNAGYVYDLKLSEDNSQILASFKIGKQHTLVDKAKQEWGSSYASSWMSIAEIEAGNTENIQSGKTYKDFIPENIYKEFFEGKTILPFTGLSVELDWTEEPETIGGVTHIKKYSIVRVSLLISDKAGQQQSRLNIKNYKLRSMNEELQKIQQNLDLFDSSDLLKIRTAELSNEYLVYQEIKQRACAMCEAEMKRKQDELNATKKRSEDELQTQINELKATIQAMQDMMTQMSTKSVEIETTRDAKATLTSEQTPEVSAEPVDETPRLTVIKKTRMGAEKTEFETKQEIKNRIKL